MANNMLIIYATFPSLEVAREVAATMLDDGLVACVNILPHIESHYSWQGVREASTEVAALFKTSAGLQQQAMDRIAILHPYDCPAIMAITAEAGKDFAAWVNGCVGSDG